MKEIIKNKLAGMKSLEERKILRDVLEGVFMPLYEHNLKRYDILEERVFDELKFKNDWYDVYATVLHIDRVDPIHRFLRPVDSQDLSQTVDWDKLKEQINNSGSVFYNKVYFSCSHSKINDILSSYRTFTATMVTDEDTYKLKVKLSRYSNYLNKIKNLYRYCLQNGVAWRSVLAPYFFKFASITLDTEGITLSEKEQIEKIDINFEELSDIAKFNMVPLWNIDVLNLKNTGFASPIPCEDTINYEHVVSIKEYGIDNGYLVDFTGQDIHYTRRRENEVVITAASEEARKWRLIQVIKPTFFPTDYFEYPLFSNAKAYRFADGYSTAATVIRTKAEIFRKIRAFSIAKSIDLVDVKVVKPRYAFNSVTYNTNDFIVDEIRSPGYQQVLLLTFYSKYSEEDYVEDIISFLTSEIQVYYPEYDCRGCLV